MVLVTKYRFKTLERNLGQQIEQLGLWPVIQTETVAKSDSAMRSVVSKIILFNSITIW
ncbi:hypothetical protein [Paenibacillus sp. ISL-20]|uniref:hypothetical protein n=1 Tax=Paenibacillus sp. ISL-20 TaxID=2819163 RepID=UPI001BE8CAD8|nr:hypothetical protein [Paenibacillus sp. ISL-20]MBT2762386.1 hypothetical protein [Paenibacillus sp. ISL-20]